jgi:hypothetical protein
MRHFSRLSGPVAAWTGLDRLRDTTTTNGNRLCAVQSSLEADSEKTKTGPGPVASKIVKKPDQTGLSNTRYEGLVVCALLGSWGKHNAHSGVRHVAHKCNVCWHMMDNGAVLDVRNKVPYSMTFVREASSGI